MLSKQNFGKYEMVLPKLDIIHQPDAVPNHIQIPDYTNIRPIAKDPIHIHQEDEIIKIRNAARIAANVLKQGIANVQPGMTTLELNNSIRDLIFENNSYPSPLNYRSFPKSICTSVNNVLCHGIPDDRELVDGDIVNIDVTVYCDGYHGDLSTMCLIGNVDEPGKELVLRNKEALELALSVVEPGQKFNEIGRVIEEYATKYGYTVDRNFCGHGIGSRFHQEPLVCHFKNDMEAIMEPGMIFTIEPVFIQGRSGYKIWPDGWTVVSKDGSRSAQHEHTVLVTSNGYEVLTA